MNKRICSIVTLGIAFAGSTQLSQAEQHAASLDAHVHGLSELTIAMEGETLEIQFSSPTMNLVGFEHKANAKEDIAAIESAEAQLRNHKTLFLFSGDRCDHVKTSIDLSDLIESNDHEHTHHNHSTKHNDEHEHEAHTQNDSHSDVVVNYTYRCENTSSLSAITVDFFK